MLGSKGEVTIVCVGPCEKPYSHDYYTESGSDGYVKMKAWLKILVQKKWIRWLCQNQNMVEGSGPEEAKTWRHIVLYALSWRIWTSFLGLFLVTFACLIRSYILGVNSKNYVLYIFSSSEFEQIRLSKLK